MQEFQEQPKNNQPTQGTLRSQNDLLGPLPPPPQKDLRIYVRVSPNRKGPSRPIC